MSIVVDVFLYNALFYFYIMTMEQYSSSFDKITSLGQDLIDTFVNVEGTEKHSTEKGSNYLLI